MARQVLADAYRFLDVDLDITLEALPELLDDISHDYGKLSSTAGAYISDEDRPVIMYSPRRMRTPVAFHQHNGA